MRTKSSADVPTCPHPSSHSLPSLALPPRRAYLQGGRTGGEQGSNKLLRNPRALAALDSVGARSLSNIARANKPGDVTEVRKDVTKCR